MRVLSLVTVCPLRVQAHERTVRTHKVVFNYSPKEEEEEAKKVEPTPRKNLRLSYFSFLLSSRSTRSNNISAHVHLNSMKMHHAELSDSGSPSSISFVVSSWHFIR
jgi:hypothetical protein